MVTVGYECSLLKFHGWRGWKKISDRKTGDKIRKALLSIYFCFDLCCNSCILICSHQLKKMKFPFNTSKPLNNTSSESKISKQKSRVYRKFDFLPVRWFFNSVENVFKQLVIFNKTRIAFCR